MKKIIIGIFSLLLAACGARAQGVVNGEYFFDKDPGIGLGKPIAFTAGDTVNVTDAISVSSLSGGFHNLFIRVKDSSKHWSLYEGRNFYVQPSVSVGSAPQIVAAEYFFDKDPGQGLGTPIATGAPADSINITQSISFASLTPGYHSMFIRTKNAAGEWSLYEGRNIYIQPTVVIPAAPKIVAAEYFFDKDPGQGLGTGIPTGAPADSINITQSISFASLSVGYHNMFIRTENASGEWSLYEGRNVYIAPTPVKTVASRITTAEYFFDNDPGQGNGTPLTTGAPADSVNKTVPISVASLTPGFHNLFIRTKDSLGIWSLYDGSNFYVQPPVVKTPPARIVAAEVFYDKDPGQGNGIAVTGITPADSINITQLVSASSLSIGKHSVFIRVEDSTGHWSLYQGDTIKVEVCTVKGTTTITKDSCFGGSDGTAMANPSGGNPPYTYSWNDGQTTQMATGLTAGIYTVTITDSVGCPASVTATVGQPTQIKVTTTPIATTCGLNNGQALAKASGGTGTTYSYTWNTIPPQTGPSATGLAPGTYTVTVTDQNNCSVTGTVLIGSSTAIALTAVYDSSKCGQHIGSATVIASSGTAPYRFSWNNGDTLATADSLYAGVYICTVTDKNGCSTFIPVDITNSNGPLIGINSINEVKCYGQTTGSVSVSVIGGNKPYTYLWSTGNTTTAINGLAAGPYYIQVTDVTGCEGVASFLITQPSSPISLAYTSTTSGCSVPSGTATVYASGGTPGYTYTWEGAGSTTDSITAQFAGSYTAMVTDANGCKDSIQAAISSKNGPVITIDSVRNATCSTILTGAVYISVTGGTPGYTYLWSNNTSSTSQNLSGVSTGPYNVTVTDALGCQSSVATVVPETPPPAISICMVTVDTASQHNDIVWNKSASPRIEKYNIYKETTIPGLFNKIGSVPSSALCTFIDTVSNVNVRSWRYEISQVDSCGFESQLSLPHKTMHLTINQYGANVNLIWDNYEGLPFSYYIVYRDSMPDVSKDSINYVTNIGIYTFTDAPPPASHTWYYHMGISNPGGCAPAIESINYNSSKSNSGNTTLLGFAAVNGELNSLQVFPNPTTGMINFNITLSTKQDIKVKVYNALGQVLSTINYGGVEGFFTRQIDLSGYSKGMYILQVIGDNGVTYKKVVLQ